MNLFLTQESSLFRYIYVPRSLNPYVPTVVPSLDASPLRFPVPNPMQNKLLLKMTLNKLYTYLKENMSRLLLQVPIPNFDKKVRQPTRPSPPGRSSPSTTAAPSRNLPSAAPNSRSLSHLLRSRLAPQVPLPLQLLRQLHPTASQRTFHGDSNSDSSPCWGGNCSNAKSRSTPRRWQISQISQSSKTREAVAAAAAFVSVAAVGLGVVVGVVGYDYSKVGWV